MNEGGDGWGIDLQLYLHSTMVPQYNPLTEFLDGCGRWYGHKDHIAELARRIPTNYEDWEPLFHCWFLAMVAQWMNIESRFSNMLVPMLIGGQGTHKTTFCRMLLPPVLSDYFVDDIKMDNAEQVERVLARMALVNIDEYNATASFIATTNSPTPLTDPTGSRRYICCPVQCIINTEPTVNYRQLYAQAVYEIKHGVRYYPTREEEQRMEQHNQQFQMLRKADIVLTDYFEPMERAKENLMMFNEIEKVLRTRIPASQMPTISELSTALTQHFQIGAVKGNRGWYMRPKE